MGQNYNAREDMDMPPKRPLGVIFLSWLLLLPLAGIAGTGDSVRARLEQLRDDGKPTVAGAPLVSVGLLDDFYRRRNDRSVWHSSRQVDDLLRLVEHSIDEGFQPSDFHAGEIVATARGRAPSDLSAATRADLEILLSDSLLRLIHHYRHGKIDPRRLGKHRNHGQGASAHDLIDDLERVIRAEDLQVAVEGLASRPRFYKRLQQGLVRYRRIAAAGGWPQIPAGRSLRPFMRDSRVPIIRERLRATGDFTGAASNSPLYDQALKTAVLAFQRRHRLGADATVGPTTRAAMNVSVTKRVNQIRINLERMRWISDGLPDDFLLVNIPEQRVKLFRDGRPVWSSRVIVGRRDRPTPAFRDQMEYLEINPSWTIPPTILKKDILPVVRRNPGYLKRRGLQVVTRSGKPVSPRSVNWKVSPASFPYLIRQPPGTRNALGQVKFMFPNQHSVYLHDTPSRSLFKRARRLYSSGCVRVEHPWKLAELLLDDPKRWNRTRFKKIVASKQTRLVHLKEPLAIVLAYWTVEGDADDKVLFWKDIYTWDPAMLKALDRRSQPRILRHRPVPPEPATPAPPEEPEAAEPPPVWRPTIKTLFDFPPLDLTPSEGPLDVH
ncbi:L,D-transpeptidase family protein [Candidatus Thiosymbion oneisti]|uniref:L,D-transpeptidase family protein n=2 Tax=Candidatus Thiosymbion oneisti TaxID=589554 RepID=UPI001060E5F4|nr:L,D-transpeptidase family protein [Candidatus Thiosymbion oneisti]